MTVKQIETLEDYYSYVEEVGSLRTINHAVHWSDATLQMLGVNLGPRAKRALKKALPDSLSYQLGRVFWLAYFRDLNMPAREFATRVARRSKASSDPDFALYPIKGVFGGLKALVKDDDLIEQIRDDLSPELSKYWEEA
ncbi:MAG: DUF2267 domain-containing protein [Chloroflexota bacterium]